MAYETGASEGKATSERCTVLIVGGWLRRCQSLYALLRALPEARSIQISGYQHAWMSIVNLQPQVVVFDYWFPCGDVGELTAALKSRYPHIRSLFLGSSSSAAPQNGVTADLTLEGGAPAEAVVDAVRRLLVQRSCAEDGNGGSPPLGSG